jgi:hypothetical protein
MARPRGGFAMKLAPLMQAAALLVPASHASAQPQPQGWSRAEQPATQRHVRRRGYLPPPAGPVCIPWRQWDQNPCDPPSFKIADGRCFQEG